MNSLFRRAKTESTPLIKGERVTFVWRGKHAPVLVGDFNDWEMRHALALRERERDIWTRTISFPRDTYMEYAYFLGDKRVLDPLNPRTTPNGIGATNNYFYMPTASPTALCQRARKVPHGTLTRHVVESFVLGERPIHLYQPPAPGPYPMLVVLDGQDYLRRAKLDVMVDNLIAQKRIRPFAMVFVESRRASRGLEYSFNEGFFFFVSYHLLPFVQDHLPLKRGRGAHAILGASLGGLIALYGVLRLPNIFGKALSQSGAFRLFDHETLASYLVRHNPVAPSKIWMDVGRYEWLLEGNREFYRLLRTKSYAVTYREYNAGHNYPAWRDDVWRGLEALFAN